MSGQSTGLPSTVKAMSPITLRLKPVAVTMMSASISSPDFVRMPVSVKVSISSVTIDALPAVIAGEQVAVGHEGQALLPGPVARGEVRVDVVALGQQVARRP